MRSEAEQVFKIFPFFSPKISKFLEKGVKMHVWALNDSRKNLSVPLKVFFTLVACADTFGRITLRQEELAKYIGTSRQTVGKYISDFVACNMLKFKYSGKGIINPEFMFNGPKEQFNVAKETYEEFKSDFNKEEITTNENEEDKEKVS